MHNARHQLLNVPGSRPRTGLLSVGSQFLDAYNFEILINSCISYVQELEARLVHMEGLFHELAPVLEQVGGPSSPTSPANNDPNEQHNLSIEEITHATTILRSLHNKHIKPPPAPPTPKSDDDVSDSFGQLALDEYGHMRWIGGSSTMSLIQSFKAMTASSPLQRYSPMEEDPHAPGPSVNKIYFPASVFFGKVRALPGPEEVEYPERDLADKLVSTSRLTPHFSIMSLTNDPPFFVLQVDAYFSRLHYLMPVIDKPSFLHSYTKIMDNTLDFELARSETAFIALLFSVFACSASLVDDPRLNTGTADDGGMGMVYYERYANASLPPCHGWS